MRVGMGRGLDTAGQELSAPASRPGGRRRGRGWRGLCRVVILGVAGAALSACAQAGGDGPGSAAAAPPALHASAFGDFLAGRYAQSVHDNKAAAGYFASALNADGRDTMLQRATMLLLVKSGEMAQAAPYAREILAADPADPAASLVQTALDFGAGNDAAAGKVLSHVPQSGLDKVMVPLLSAWADLGAGKGKPASVDRALASVAVLNSYSGITGFASYYTALVNDTAGRTAAADAAYRTAMAATDSGDPLVVEAYGRFLSRQNRFAEAAALYRTYLQSGENPPLRMMMVEVTAHRRLPPMVRNARDGAAEVFYDIASVMPPENNSDTMQLFFQIALYLRPDLAKAKIMLATIYTRENRLPEALAAYRSIDPKSPFGEDVQISIAWLLNQLNRPDEAEAMLEKLARSHPVDQVNVLGTMGDISRDHGKYADAVAHYTAALKAAGPPEESDWSLFYTRGIAYDQMKQWPQAEADFLTALKLEPDQPMVLNYLGYSWIVRGEHMTRALGMIEQAVTLSPKDGYIVDSLGWAYYRLGRYHQAVSELETAVTLLPADPTVNEHLGDAYWRVGRRLEARYQWQRALTFKPDADKVPELKAKIADGLTRMGEAPHDRRSGI